MMRPRGFARVLRPRTHPTSPPRQGAPERSDPKSSARETIRIYRAREKKIVSFVFDLPYFDSNFSCKQSESSSVDHSTPCCECIKKKKRSRFPLNIELNESVLQTCVYRLCRSALLTLDLAAPVEDAVAPLDHHHLLSLVAPSAAHQIAAVDAEAGVVALSSVGAQDTERGILLAETRRVVHVDEVFRPGRLVLRIVRL